jgi:hypothetical protein
VLEEPIVAMSKVELEESSVKPRRRLKRNLVIALVAILIAAGGVGLYVRHLGAEARTVYKLGSTINTFFAEYTSSLKKNDVDAVLDKYHEDYASPSEGTWEPKLLWEDAGGAQDKVSIYHWEEKDKRPYTKKDVRKQIEGLVEQVNYVSLAKIKIEDIEENDGLKSATLKTMLWLRGNQEDGEKVETHAYFRLWLIKDDGWKIRRSELLQGVTVRGAGTGFADVTQSAGIDFEAKHNPMLSKEGWRPDKFEIMKYSHGGVTTSDYDGDGWYDIFFPDGEKPRLYRNNGDGTFADVTAKAGLPDHLEGVHVALFADFDNDGDAELFLGRSTGDNKLYRNEGDGTFTDVTETANIGGFWVPVASSADYNNDGKLDLYIGRYLDPRINLPTTLFYTRNGVGNSLLRNDGDLKFTDVTEEAGVREGGLTLGVTWGDYDSDGHMDLYVANDFGRNTLFRNRGDGTFEDVSKATGTADIAYGMSASFADLDNDCDLDIFVSNVHSGQRWFGNEATLKNYMVTSIKQGAISEDKAMFDEIMELMDGKWATVGDRVVRGNSMFLNENGTFADVSENYHINPHGWYWGSVVFDYDNDGLQDIYAVNGWITGTNPDDL